MRFLLSLILIIGCQDELPEEQEALEYSSASICDCYDSAVLILGTMLDTRLLHDTYESYLADQDDVLIIEGLKNDFNVLREECLSSYGANLFVTSECNYPCDLSLLSTQLHILGIQV